MRYNFLFPLIFSLKNLGSFPLLFIAFQVKLKIGSKQIKLKPINPQAINGLKTTRNDPIGCHSQEDAWFLGLYFQLS
jgi:hypothetical protein